MSATKIVVWFRCEAFCAGNGPSRRTTNGHSGPRTIPAAASSEGHAAAARHREAPDALNTEAATNVSPDDGLFSAMQGPRRCRAVSARSAITHGMPPCSPRCHLPRAKCAAR
ncbi:protein of unknown function (plasmid) [Paraburkholderia kururiensis]